MRECGRITRRDDEHTGKMNQRVAQIYQKQHMFSLSIVQFIGVERKREVTVMPLYISYLPRRLNGSSSGYSWRCGEKSSHRFNIMIILHPFDEIAITWVVYL